MKNKKLIEGDIFKKDSGDFYIIKGSKFDKDDPSIVWDVIELQYVIRTPRHVKGVYKFDKEGRSAIGVSKVDKKATVFQKGAELYPIFNEESFKEYQDLFKYNPTLDTYYHKYDKIANETNKGFLSIERRVKENFFYSVQGFQLEEFRRSIDNLDENSFKEAYESFGLTLQPFIEDLTFGIEYETDRGVVPSKTLSKLPLIPLRDGSIGGLEYATPVLQGYKGLHLAHDAMTALKKYTQSGESCSIHYHVGGLPRTKEHILAMLKVIYLIQDSLYEMFPFYKRENCGIKNKNYTKAYPIELLTNFDSVINESNVDKNFEILFEYLSEGRSFKQDYGGSLENVQNHPNDPENNRKWVISKRYHIVNLIPLLFGNKTTVEFRLSENLSSPSMIVTQAILNMAIVQFVKKNSKSILNNTARCNIIDIIYSFNSSFCEKLERFCYKMRMSKQNAAKSNKIKYNVQNSWMFSQPPLEYSLQVPYQIFTKNNVDFDKRIFPLKSSILNPNKNVNYDFNEIQAIEDLQREVRERYNRIALDRGRVQFVDVNGRQVAHVVPNEAIPVDENRQLESTIRRVLTSLYDRLNTLKLSNNYTNFLERIIALENLNPVEGLDPHHYALHFNFGDLQTSVVFSQHLGNLDVLISSFERCLVFYKNTEFFKDACEKVSRVIDLIDATLINNFQNAMNDE